MVFGVGWTVTLRVEQISLLLPERIPELYQSLYKAGAPPPRGGGGGVVNSTRFGPKGPVINLEQVSNAATDAAISYLPKCRKPRVIGAILLVLLCIFVVAGAHNIQCRKFVLLAGRKSKKPKIGGPLQRDIQLPNHLYRVKDDALEVSSRPATVLSGYLRILQKVGFTLSPSMGHFKGALYRVS